VKAVRDENGMEWKGNGNGNGNGMKVEWKWKWKWKWKWNANAVVSAAKASDAQALASLDRSQWPVASGEWHFAFVSFIGAWRWTDKMRVAWIGSFYARLDRA
jgi:hypothetical protein